MRSLIDDHGADVNQLTRSRFGLAVMAACFAGWNEGLDMLIKRGANLNVAGGIWGSVFSTAAYKGHLETIQWLLDHDANLDMEDTGRYGQPLQSAAISTTNSLVMMRLFFRNGANVHAKGGAFGYALQGAALRRSLKAVLLLIRKGADVNAKGGRYHTALQASCAAGNEKITRMLLRHGADVNAFGGRYGSPLQAACVFGRPSTVRLLLQSGADVDAEGGFYGTCLQAAALNNRAEVVSILLYEADPRWVSINRKLNHASVKVLDRADELLSNPPEPVPASEIEKPSKEDEAEPDLEELLGTTNGVHGPVQEEPKTNARHATTWPTAPMLATKLRNVRIMTSAVDEMKTVVHTKTMRELGFGDDTPPTAWLEWGRGDA